MPRGCTCTGAPGDYCFRCRTLLLRANGVGATAVAALPPMTEKQLQSQVREVARRLGALHFHTYRSTRSEPGFPDSVLVVGQSLYLLELKVDDAHPTLAQQRWLDALAKVTRVVSGVVRPGTLPQWVQRIQDAS